MQTQRTHSCTQWGRRIEGVACTLHITICKTESQWEFAQTLLCEPRGLGWGGRWEGGSRGRGPMCTYG